MKFHFALVHLCLRRNTVWNLDFAPGVLQNPPGVRRYSSRRRRVVARKPKALMRAAAHTAILCWPRADRGQPITTV
jgi:hypothetical protein